MQEAQLLCMELGKQMEEFYPVLQRAAGQPVAMGAAQTALQHGFVAYTYSFSENQQLLQQANSAQFNPQLHVDYAKWAQAMQNNPDPRSCYPEQMIGLPALEARVMQQQQAVDECNNLLEELRQGFGNLKDQMRVQSMQRLEECRIRHQTLSRQLLKVVTAVEAYALHTGAARINPHTEARIEEQFVGLEQALAAPASARTRLEELWALLRGMSQESPGQGSTLASTSAAGTGATITDAEAERTLLLTASQGELLELLQDEVARRTRDIAQFESTLARFSGAAAQSTSQPLSAAVPKVGVVPDTAGLSPGVPRTLG